MINYKKLYFQLFNAVTDAINSLQQAQIDAEDTYIEDSESENNSTKVTKLKVYSSDKDEEK